MATTTRTRGIYLTWSPDSQDLVFPAENELRRVSIVQGQLCQDDLHAALCAATTGSQGRQGSRGAATVARSCSAGMTRECTRYLPAGGSPSAVVGRASR